VLTLVPQLAPGRRAKILLLGAHSDDIEIGCGATLLQLGTELNDARIHWVVFSDDGPRADEARASARAFLSGFEQSRVSVEVLGFRDAYFPDSFREIKEFFDGLQDRFVPDLVFTHGKQDLHQDHRLLAELTWNTFRNHLILEYEIPKYDGGLRDPNVFVPLTKELCDRKVELLLEHFKTQKGKHWFDREVFLGLMRLRGLEGCTPAGYAEAFHCRKATLSWTRDRDRT
jgi:LmbE family N-acetylglucosaminyl deacetylase